MPASLILELPEHKDPRVTLLLNVAYRAGDLPDVVLDSVLAVVAPVTFAASDRVVRVAFQSIADWLDNAHTAHVDGVETSVVIYTESAVAEAQDLLRAERIASEDQALGIALPVLTAVPDYMHEVVGCNHCRTSMTRASLIEHECDELRDSRERGRKFLERLGQ